MALRVPAAAWSGAGGVTLIPQTSWPAVPLLEAGLHACRAGDRGAAE